MTEVQKQYLTDALRKEGVPALQMGPTLDAFRRGGWMETARALRAQSLYRRGQFEALNKGYPKK